MDPIITGIVVVLGKHLIDKASEATPIMGKKAVEVLGRLFSYVTEKLTEKGGREEVVVDGFTNDPETYEKPFAKVLQLEFENNPVFAAKVKELVNEYNNIVDSQNVESSYKIRVEGNLKSVGSVFGSGSVSVNKGDIVGSSKSLPSER